MRRIFSSIPQSLWWWTSTRSCAVFLRRAATALIGRTWWNRSSCKPSASWKANHDHLRPAGRQRHAQRVECDFSHAGLHLHQAREQDRAPELHDHGVLYVGDFSVLLPDVSRLSGLGFAPGTDAVFESGMVPSD